jgi:hypothetical protein
VATLIATCGIIAAAVGTWRGYVVAREALGPFIHEGEPTRTAIDATRPILARARVRLLIRRGVVAVGWITVALYGLLLIEEASAVR